MKEKQKAPSFFHPRCGEEISEALRGSFGLLAFPRKLFPPRQNASKNCCSLSPHLYLSPELLHLLPGLCVLPPHQFDDGGGDGQAHQDVHHAQEHVGAGVSWKIDEKSVRFSCNGILPTMHPFFLRGPICLQPSLFQPLCRNIFATNEAHHGSS